MKPIWRTIRCPIDLIVGCGILFLRAGYWLIWWDVATRPAFQASGAARHSARHEERRRRLDQGIGLLQSQVRFADGHRHNSIN